MTALEKTAALLSVVEQGRDAFLNQLSSRRRAGDSDSRLRNREEPRGKVSDYGTERFLWNNRECYGTKFHVEVLCDNQEEVLSQLAQDASRLHEQFGYITKFNSKDQICTGQAVHLAASRGHLILVELLLEKRASVNSMVRRDGYEHYDVFHAAVFKEGRGGDSGMIRFLCAMNADPNGTNLNGLTSLHVAFQTGNEDTIRAVQVEAKRLAPQAEESDTDVEKEVDFDDHKREETPLEVGIRWGKMNKESLSRAAPLHIGSLKVFIHRAPEVIPIFLNRLRNRAKTDENLSMQLSRKLKSKDIARLLRDFPEAAAALLEGVTDRPKVTSEGWHPLPSRVSFAQRTWFRRLLRPLIVNRHYLVFYKPEMEWGYDDAKYEPPAWHQQLEAWKDPPTFDAHIQVCCIPNLISPAFFSALLEPSVSGEPTLFLYENSAIRAAVSFTFWNGAVWAELVHFLMSLWGLTLLVVESWMAHEAAVESELEKQRLWSVFEPSFVGSSVPRGVVADWIIAKGLVDVCMELAQFTGCLMIREPSAYFTAGNLIDIVRGGLPILLLWFYEVRVIHLLIVLIYWMRLLEGVTHCETIGHALLPLAQLASGLMPAMSFTLVGFCALTHASYAVQVHPDHMWPDTLFQSFTLLITQGLPEHPPSDSLELLVLYVGVLFFSIFVLNIFIGVISEQYSNEKAKVNLMFQSVRASCCLTFLLRLCCLPFQLVTKETASATDAALCVIATLGLQVESLCFSRQLPGFAQLGAFVTCQLVAYLAAIQCKGDDVPWTHQALKPRFERQDLTRSDTSYTPMASTAVGGKADKTRYLWICEPRESDLHHGPHTRAVSSAFSLLAESSSSDEQLKMVRQALREEIAAAIPRCCRQRCRLLSPPPPARPHNRGWWSDHSLTESHLGERGKAVG
ncbi:unnamed protein product [Effrenium voratum]|nr:unnamed protein product [Effrenium voratum]